MITIATITEVDKILSLGQAAIFKHSTRCPISAAAYAEVTAYEQAHSNNIIYLIDVIESRAVSQYLAEKISVTHESPQVIILKNGKPIWHASHSQITQATLENAFSFTH